jgi:pimeloyl-ACP methyl ester carboxylesterase
MSKHVNLLKTMAMASPDEGVIALLNGMKERPDRTAVLQDPLLPLLLIGGLKDNYIPVDVFEKLTALAPHARILRLENSGHQGFMEEPEKVVEAMLAFLDSLPGA